MVCKEIPTCRFFEDNMEEAPAISGLLKRRYCTTDFEACARYQIHQALGREAIPKDLFPNDLEKAQALIAKHL